jgi:hypothetical protein
MKPDAKLPGHPELVERLTVVTADVVSSGVPSFPKSVEQLPDLARHKAGVTKPAQRLGLILIGGGV